MRFHTASQLLIGSLALLSAEAFQTSLFGGLKTPAKVQDEFRLHPAFVLKDPVDTESVLKSIQVTKPDTETEVIQAKGLTAPWEVHKFGGASLATAQLYETVGDLLIEEAKGREETGPIPTMAVVSAKGGMTDLLVKVVDSALSDIDQAEIALEEAVSSQLAVLEELVPGRPDITGPIEARFRQDQADIFSVVQSLRMLHTVPAVTMEVVSGYGEIWSAQTLHAYLQSKDVIPTDWMDARDVLIVKSEGAEGLGEKGSSATGGVTPLWEETGRRMHTWWDSLKINQVKTRDFSKSAPIVVVTGFVARSVDNVPTTLKRSGSDFSATIFGKLTNAGRVTMWKNTNGVYTADPRQVPEAFPIASLKYDEAMELAYFGAQVLHPSAMGPCIEKNIPVYVRNIFNPSFEGTVIQGRSPSLKDVKQENVKSWRAKSGEIPIKGITSVNKVSLVNLEGATLAGANVAKRVLGALSEAGINILIITQASCESSITIAVPENQGKTAIAKLEDAFELELARSTIGSVSLVEGMSIVAIVGEGMEMTSGVASTFIGSLAQANVNLRLVAQGSSEHQIAVVVAQEDCSRALRAAHQGFTLSETTASVAILGATGVDGAALRAQIVKQKDMLSEEMGAAISVNLASCSKRMSVAKNSKGLDVANVRAALRSDEDSQPFDLDEITDIMKSDVNPLRVIVDCTDIDETGDYYEKWLNAGIHIISSGRKVGSGDLDRYHRICEAQKGHTTEWYLDSSIGSALPIMSTIRDLKETGDNIRAIEGSLSETMAYVLSVFNETVSFSEALEMASTRGYAERNLYEDLSGNDMARKVVILARSIGLDLNMEDVEIESFLPKDMKCSEDDCILEDIKVLDPIMLERYLAAKEQDKKIRYKFSIDVELGKAKISIEDVDKQDPLFRMTGVENVIYFDTSRYEDSPLLIKGAAAGPDLTAAGIFADLLRLTRAYSAHH